MCLDVLQEACQGAASDFLGTVEWPIDSVDEFWRIMESRFAKTSLVRMQVFDLCKQTPGQSYRNADFLTEKAYGLNIPRKVML